jgi:hypothetical protein
MFLLVRGDVHANISKYIDSLLNNVTSMGYHGGFLSPTQIHLQFH